MSLRTTGPAGQFQDPHAGHMARLLAARLKDEQRSAKVHDFDDEGRGAALLMSTVGPHS